MFLYAYKLEGQSINLYIQDFIDQKAALKISTHSIIDQHFRDIITTKDLSQLTPVDEDVVAAGVLYAEDWLINDKKCECDNCYVLRTLCETITNIVFSVPERLDS